MFDLSREFIYDNLGWEDSFSGLYPGYSQSPSKFNDDFRFESQDQAEGYADEVLDIFRDLADNGTVVLYRSIAAESEEDIDKEMLGEHWSWEEVSARNFADNNLWGGDSVFLVTAATSPNNIDWERSVNAYLQFSGNYSSDDENELVVIDESLLEIVNIEQIRKKKVLSSQKINQKEYYNTHGHTYTFQEFIDTEVDERENYTHEEIDDWVKKYNISLTDECIWVTEDLESLEHYDFDPDDYSVYSDSEGFIISESDDGDGGYLFVFRNQKNLNQVFFTGYKNYKGDYFELYIDPTLRELRALKRGIRAWLIGEHMVAWEEYADLHGNVLEYIRKDKSLKDIDNGNFVSIYFNVGSSVVEVTDATAKKGSRYFHNPDIYDYIENHPALSSLIPNMDITYFDEDISGRWEEEKSQNLGWVDQEVSLSGMPLIKNQIEKRLKVELVRVGEQDGLRKKRKDSKFFKKRTYLNLYTLSYAVIDNTTSKWVNRSGQSVQELYKHKKIMCPIIKFHFDTRGGKVQAGSIGLTLVEIYTYKFRDNSATYSYEVSNLGTMALLNKVCRDLGIYMVYETDLEREYENLLSDFQDAGGSLFYRGDVVKYTMYDMSESHMIGNFREGVRLLKELLDYKEYFDSMPATGDYEDYDYGDNPYAEIASSKDNLSYISDRMRADYIQVALSSDVDLSLPDKRKLKDTFNGYDDLIKVYNRGNYLEYFEGFVSDCWKGFYLKPEYKGMTKEEILSSFMSNRFPLIVSPGKIIAWGYINSILSVKISYSIKQSKSFVFKTKGVFLTSKTIDDILKMVDWDFYRRRKHYTSNSSLG
jgi:hypothetical protein